MPDPTRPTWTNTQQVIAYSLVASFIGVIFVWMLLPPKGVDQSVLTVVNMLLGALVAKFTTIVDFFFGSSQGSKDKDDAQNKLVTSLTGTGNGAGTEANRAEKAATAATAAAALAAPAAAAIAAPPAAAVAAPPVVEKVVPPAVKAAVDQAMEARTARDEMQKLSQATAAEEAAPEAAEKAVRESPNK